MRFSILIKIVLIIILFAIHELPAQIGIDEMMSEGYLSVTDMTSEELQNLFDYYSENPLVWRRLKQNQLEELPLSIDIKECLITLIRTRKKYNDWAVFAADAGLNNNEMKIVRKFIILNEKDVSKGEIQNYFSMKKDETLMYLTKTLLKSRYRTASGWYAGMVVESDQNEPQVWDYGNITLRSPVLNDRWSFLGGAFRMNWGHGLLMSSNLMNGRSYDAVQNVVAGSSKATNYQGTDENQFLFGGLAETRLHTWTLFSFFSSHGVDASIENDSVLSLKTDGLHVSKSAMEAKDALGEITFGSGMKKSFANSEFGILVIRMNYSYPIMFLDGKNQRSGISFFYKMEISDWCFSGEVAGQEPGGIAMVQTITRCIGPATLAFSGRYFPSSYYSLMGSTVRAFSGNPMNEKGLYTGLRLRLKYGWWFSSYADFYGRIQSDIRELTPTKGNELAVNFGKKFRKENRFDIKFRRSLEWRSLSGEPTLQIYQLSGNGYYAMSGSIGLTGRLSHVVLKNEQLENGTALGISGDIRIKNEGRLTIGTTHFYTISFDSRIYFFEPGIPLRFNMVSLSGTGYRYYAVFRKQFNNRFDFSIAFKNQYLQRLGKFRWQSSSWLEFQMIVDL